MFRKSRASSSPTTPSTGNNDAGAPPRSPTIAEITDDYDIVSSPTGSESMSPSPAPSGNHQSRRSRSNPTPGVTPPPHVRQAASRDDWYPDWLPRRPPPPAPASTVPSEMGHGNSPIPFLPSNSGTQRGSRLPLTGAHRVTPSYDTGYTTYTGTGESYVDIGDYDAVQEESADGESRNINIGRRQTPRSVRIVSGPGAGTSSRRQASSKHTRRASGGNGNAPAVRSKKEGRGPGHVHGPSPMPIVGERSGSRAWGRATVSTPLSPTIFSPSPFPLTPGYGAPGAKDSAAPATALPPHMRGYVAQPGMMPTSPPRPPRPRFRSRNLDLGFLATTSIWMKLWYYLLPVWVYGLVVLQTYLDFNAVFCLVQIALHPTPATPPSGSATNINQSSRRNWTLAAAAYGVCWFIWIVGVVFLYEVIYSWWRLWRSKRPLMVPLYSSSPAFNLVCMTSFTNFCFFRHIRSSARPPLPVPRFLRACCGSSSGSSSRAVTPSAYSEGRISEQIERNVSSPTNGEGKENVPIIPSTSVRAPMLPPQSSLASWKDWAAETCYFYGQNLPTVALLIPRAAFCIALLLAFTTAPSEDVALADLGEMKRDQTFFDSEGALSSYAHGVLIANVAWAGWRAAVLIMSWIGLWIASGQLCAGVCGPRFGWEEPEERPGYGGVVDEESLNEAQGVQATWSWRECTRARIFDAYDLCLFPPHATIAPQGSEKGRDVSPTSTSEKMTTQRTQQTHEAVLSEEDEDAVLNRALAAAGLPSVPPLATKRGVLRGELFNTPPELRRELDRDEAIEEVKASPKPSTKKSRKSKESKEGSPSKKSMAYPFTVFPARQGSQDMEPERIPFPPSPRTSRHSDREGANRSPSITGEVTVEGEEEEEYVTDEEEYYDEFGLGPEEPSSGRASGSMSSLGQQIPSRFPFQFRHVSRRSRGGRSSTGTHHSQSTSNKTSTASYGVMSKSSRTASTPDQPYGRRESGGSTSPWSQGQLSPGASALQSPTSPHERTMESGGSSDYGSVLRSSSPIPMPPQAGHGNGKGRKQHRGSLPSIPVSAIPAGFSEVRNRSRTLSASTRESVEMPRPHPLYESDEEEEEEEHEHPGEVTFESEFGMMTDPEAEGSQEEAEREDSVGLLSGGPSPRSSVGGLRSRSNVSLSNMNLGIPHSRRSRQSSAASSASHSQGNNSRSSRFSGSNSGSGNGRSISFAGSVSSHRSHRERSISSQTRARAMSLIQNIGAATRSSTSIEMGFRSRTSSDVRSRASSLSRVSEVPSVHRKSGESAMSRVSGGSKLKPASPESSSSGSGSGSAPSDPAQPSASPREDFTFGQPIEVKVESGTASEVGTVNGGGAAHEQRDEPHSPDVLESVTGPVMAESISESHESAHTHAYSDETAEPGAEHVAQGLQAPMTPTQAMLVPSGPSAPQGDPSFISTAHESYITRPTIATSSDETAQTPSSYGDTHHMRGQGSGFGPA